MDSGKLFQIATQIKTPLMLAALVILVLFALYRFILRSGAANAGIAAKIPENIALYLFILALVALVLGITADKYVHSQTEEKHWLYGKVHSPPSDRTQGVPDALVYIDTGQTTKVATDPLGDFKYEIGPAVMNRNATVWAKADKFTNAEPPQVLTLVADMPKVFIPLKPVVTATPALGDTDTTNQVATRANCLDGDWGEDPPNKLRWRFKVEGDTLKVKRLDSFVSGEFKKSGDDWRGYLNWGNGDKWQNVILSPTEACNAVYTNQAWTYKR